MIRPTLWAYFEGQDFVHADPNITELCCAPAEAVRYEPEAVAPNEALRHAESAVIETALRWFVLGTNYVVTAEHAEACRELMALREAKP